MFSEKTFSIIRSIQTFGQHRKGVIRVHFPDGSFRDISAKEVSEMTFKDFAEIAVKLDGIIVPPFKKVLPQRRLK